MTTVNVLPFSAKLGLPQMQRVKISDIAYDVYYRFNKSDPNNPLLILKIVRVEDSQVVFNSAMVEYNPREVKDPATYEVLFTIMPKEIDESKKVVEVWVFEE